ncbi:MAG: HAD-IIA family hydrolase [Bifidobacteriaceae bacterium]|jgi:HAD superfamily hydrolase (TIGR01450 family)|nr:HAD-IIA family hydrolase [Bifidobacteriaceae bacterium]
MSPGHLLEIDAPLRECFSAALSDMDGVLFRGNTPVEQAADAVAAAREYGLEFVFVTNNASRPPDLAAAKLGSMRIPAKSGDVVTAAEAGVKLMAEDMEPGARVLVVGGNGLTGAVTGAGFELVAAASELPQAVIQGWSPALTWRDLEEACYAIEAGAAYYATNLDRNIPTESGLAPGNGAMVQAVVLTTGVRPKASGKPDPLIFRLAASRRGAGNPLVIGDRLDTDMAGAKNAGYVGLLVLTGVTSAADVLTAAPHERPQLIARDLTALARPHAAPVQREGRWICGEAVAWVDGNRLAVNDGPAGEELDPALDGPSNEVVRAAAAAVWEAMDRGVIFDPASIPNSFR